MATPPSLAGLLACMVRASKGQRWGGAQSCSGVGAGARKLSEGNRASLKVFLKICRIRLIRRLVFWKEPLRGLGRPRF